MKERSASVHAREKDPLGSRMESSSFDCLAEQEQLLRPALGWSVGQLRSNLRLVPDQSGIYGWWFRSFPPGVPDEGTLQSDLGHLLYIGIAPNGPKSSRTLRNRLRNHIRGPIGSSTLRRTLASLLAIPLKLRFDRTVGGRPVLSPACERRLTDWLDQEARVAWLVCERPWEAERQILATGPKLPLNIQGSSDPFSKVLSGLRAELLAR
jgi:hypothetical protein